MMYVEIVAFVGVVVAEARQRTCTRVKLCMYNIHFGTCLFFFQLNCGSSSTIMCIISRCQHLRLRRRRETVNG